MSQMAAAPGNPWPQARGRSLGTSFGLTLSFPDVDLIEQTFCLSGVAEFKFDSCLGKLYDQ